MWLCDVEAWTRKIFWISGQTDYEGFAFACCCGVDDRGFPLGFWEHKHCHRICIFQILLSTRRSIQRGLRDTKPLSRSSDLLKTMHAMCNASSKLSIQCETTLSYAHIYSHWFCDVWSILVGSEIALENVCSLFLYEFQLRVAFTHKLRIGQMLLFLPKRVGFYLLIFPPPSPYITGIGISLSPPPVSTNTAKTQRN